MWLLAFKRDDQAGAEPALAQIRARGYRHEYTGRELSLVGIDFDRKPRNLSGSGWERVTA